MVIPYGGRRRHLGALLWSLAAQRYPAARLQVVVVECPSAEPLGRGERAARDAVGAEWLRFRRHGFAPAGARNRGLAAAGGEVVVSVDDDMVLPPGLVAAHVARHGAGSVATFGLRRFIRLPQGFRSARDVHARLDAAADLPDSASNRSGHQRDWREREARAVRRHPHPYHLFHGCNVSYPRALALEVGGWCEEFDGSWGYEDVDFGARLHAAGARLELVEEALALHLEGDPGQAAGRRRGRRRNLRLVTARVPGYAEFRRRTSLGEPADDGDLVAQEAAAGEEEPRGGVGQGGDLLGPRAVPIGGAAGGDHQLVLGHEDRRQLAGPLAEDVDDGHRHVRPLRQEHVVDDQHALLGQGAERRRHVPPGAGVGVVAVHVHQPQAGSQVAGAEGRRIAPKDAQNVRAPDHLGPAAPQVLLGVLGDAEGPAGHVVGADVEPVACRQPLRRRERPAEHERRPAVEDADLGHVPCDAVGGLAAGEAVEEQGGVGVEEPRHARQVGQGIRVDEHGGARRRSASDPAGGARRRPGRVLLIPPAPPGSLGDAAMIAGCAGVIRARGGRVWLLRVGGAPGPVAPPDVPIEEAPEDAARMDPRDWDAVVAIGADVMDGFYGAEPVRERVALLSAAADAGIPAALVGASLNADPSSEALAALRALPARVPLRMRDPHSAERARELLGRADLTADLAFRMPPDASSAGAAIAWVVHRRLRGMRVVGLNANALVGTVVPSEADVADAHAELVSSLLAVPGIAVMLLPHDRRPAADDVVLLAEVRRRLHPALHDRCRLETGLGAAATKAVCAALDLVLTGRMHLAIAAMSCGVPALCMEYQGKVAGLYAHLGLEGMTFGPGDLAAPVALAHRALGVMHDPGVPRRLRTRVPEVMRLAAANLDRP